MKWLILSLVKRHLVVNQTMFFVRFVRYLVKTIKMDLLLIESSIIKGTNKTLIFNEEDIDNLLSFQYGQSHTFSVLSILYLSRFSKQISY